MLLLNRGGNKPACALVMLLGAVSLGPRRLSLCEPCAEKCAEVEDRSLTYRLAAFVSPSYIKIKELNIEVHQRLMNKIILVGVAP